MSELALKTLRVVIQARRQRQGCVVTDFFYVHPGLGLKRAVSFRNLLASFFKYMKWSRYKYEQQIDSNENPLEHSDVAKSSAYDGKMPVRHDAPSTLIPVGMQGCSLIQPSGIALALA